MTVEVIMDINAIDLEVVRDHVHVRVPELDHVQDRDRVEEIIDIVVTVVRCQKVVRERLALAHVLEGVRLQIANRQDMIDQEPEVELVHEASRDRDLNQEIDEEKIDAINRKKDKKTMKI
jgi:hypothetical protein